MCGLSSRELRVLGVLVLGTVLGWWYLTPTELDVVPSSLLHHSTSCEAPPQSPPLVEDFEGEESDVADKIGLTESSCFVVTDHDN